MTPFLSTLGSASAKGLGRALRAFIRKPSITSPSNATTGVSRSSPTFTSNAIQIVGKGTAHASSDWQIATDSGFSNIVASTTSDTGSKTTWSPTGLTLALNTVHYVRVRYRDTTNLISDWSNSISFTTSQYLTPYVNGTQTITTASTWTVPQDIGFLRVTIYGGKGGGPGGGTVKATFSVTPGETFRVSSHIGGEGQGCAGPDGFGGHCFSFGLDTGSALDQSTLWMIAGASGAPGRTRSGQCPTDAIGGAGGGDTGGTGGGSSYFGCWPNPPQPFYNFPPSGGGTQSSGGDASSTPVGSGSPGSALRGGNGGVESGGARGGGGGAGWYGGGGGFYAGPPNSCPQNASAGGGGSSRIQIPAPRNAAILENSQGTWTDSHPTFSPTRVRTGLVYIEY